MLFAIALFSRVLLERLPLVLAEQGYGALGIEKSVQGNPIRLDGKTYAGIGTHAVSRLDYVLDGRYLRFTGRVGIDGEMATYPKSSATFEIDGDGRTLWKSGVIRHGDPSQPYRVNVAGVKLLELKVGDAGDGIDGDHADWADPVLEPAPSHRFHSQPVAARLTGRNICLAVAKDGEICQLKLGSARWVPVKGSTWLAGSPIGHAHVSNSHGRIRVLKKLLVGNTPCEVREQFTPDHGAIRWDVAISSTGPATSTPVVTAFEWPNPPDNRIWAAWNDPVDSYPNLGMAQSNVAWHDPLVPQPFSSRSWQFGETPAGNWWSGDTITLPMFSVFPSRAAKGFTFIQSPNDPMPEARLASSGNGVVAFSRNHLRIGSGHTVRFTSYLAAPDPSPRAALKFAVARFPAFFNPPLASAGDLGGCAAYSGDERALSDSETAKLRRMDFSTMWKLSDDYVYMGMFLPPTKDPGESWTRTPDGGSPAGYKPLVTNSSKLDGYAHMLRSRGFHLLGYFNAFEFGVNLKEVQDPPAAVPGLWRDASGYLAATFPNAPVLGQDGNPLGAWQGGWVMDPGDPAYRRHLLNQAKLYLKRVSDEDGICIDRADYNRLHNSRADDGISWYNGPARSLALSWERLMEPLSDLMHRRRKAIFSNLLDPRLDLAKHLDGLYCEFGNQPTVVNGASFLCLRKPLLVWTRDEDVLTDDFFQRELYLGAFPTLPYPTNNHCIGPSPQHDRWFLDYGPLFRLLKGRAWDLGGAARLSGPGKVNLFKTPKGEVAIVAFCGDAREVTLQVKGLGRVTSALFIAPGSKAAKRAVVHKTRTGLSVRVPLSRGCAAVLLR